MSVRKCTWLLAALLILPACKSHFKQDVTGYVDPFIGTAAHGHVFPGAVLPYGMVQLSPDNGRSGWDWCSGYNYADTMIAGFSHTHLSGTGIGDLCDILFLPSMEEFSLSLPDTTGSLAKLNRSSFSHRNEMARPGYYSVALDNGVTVELTAGSRSGIQRYIASHDGVINVLVDLGYAVNWDRPVDCMLQKDGNSLSGSRISSGWAKEQFVYFYSEFSLLPYAVTMLKNGCNTGADSVRGQNIAAIASFRVKEGDEVIVKTGISAVDTCGARKNLQNDFTGWDFTDAAARAGMAWQKRLGVCEDARGNRENLITFYTALYHTMIAPSLYSDADGRYRGTDHVVHSAEGQDRYTVFSLWDTYRAAHPLFTFTVPDLVPDFIRTMLDISKEQGRLPVWSLAGNETDCMIGYHSVPVIADAIHKNISGFDYEEAFDAAVNSATLSLAGLGFYRQYGYVPSDLENESVSKTLEYAVDDWCISQMASDLGHDSLAAEYLKRSGNYANVFDTTLGFVRGRMSDGSWRQDFDPLLSDHSRSDFTEGNAWQYTWLVPHDPEGLISLFGSRERFISRLDSLFNIVEGVRGDNASADISGLIGQYAHGNEPSHHIAYLFSMAGRPEMTEMMVRRIMEEMYSDRKDGLCGNEDCGQMSAWYLFSAMGFYPLNPADGKYILGSPLLDRVSLNLPGGKKFTVVSKNNGPGKYSVKKVFLNGRRLRRNYITYNEIMSGGTLRFVMN